MARKEGREGGREGGRGGTFHAGHIDDSLVDASDSQGLRNHEKALLHSQGLRHIPQVPVLGREGGREGKR